MSAAVKNDSDGGVSDISDGSDGERNPRGGPIYDTSDDEESGDDIDTPRAQTLNRTDSRDGRGVVGDVAEESSDRETLRIQVASDLHIEFYDKNRSPPNFLIEPRAPILALLGDVGLACTDQLRDFLHAQADRFERVLFVPGNHEYYNRRSTTYCMDEQDRWMQSVCSERDSLHFMDNDSMVLNGVLVLGSTLWSEIPDEMLWEAEASMNDYALSYNHDAGEEPRRVTAMETRQFHRESVAWLRSRVDEAKRDGRKVVVLTHHTPLMTGTSHPRYEGGSLSCCFSSDLRGLLLCGGPPIVAWACGHTHYNFDFVCGSVRVFSNQRGYRGSPKGEYDRGGIVLEVDSKK